MQMLVKCISLKEKNVTYTFFFFTWFACSFFRDFLQSFHSNLYETLMLTGVITNKKKTPHNPKKQNTQLRISGSKFLSKSSNFIYLFRKSVHAYTHITEGLFLKREIQYLIFEDFFDRL